MAKLQAMPHNSSVHDAATEKPEFPPNIDLAGSGFDGRDALGVVGLVVFLIGIWQVYPPAAWISLGTALLLIAWRA